MQKDPMEKAYERFNPGLSIVGGIDLDFLCRSDPELIYRRTKAMLQRTGVPRMGGGEAGTRFRPTCPMRGSTQWRAVLEETQGTGSKAAFHPQSRGSASKGSGSVLLITISSTARVRSAFLA